MVYKDGHYYMYIANIGLRFSSHYNFSFEIFKVKKIVNLDKYTQNNNFIVVPDLDVVLLNCSLA